MFDENASDRHKLAVHVVSMSEGGAGHLPTDIEINEDCPKPAVIEDVTVFKSSHGMYPLVQPYISITRKGNRCKL